MLRIKNEKLQPTFNTAIPNVNVHHCNIFINGTKTKEINGKENVSQKFG
jgi:hypothetical protein